MMVKALLAATRTAAPLVVVLSAGFSEVGVGAAVVPSVEVPPEAPLEVQSIALAAAAYLEAVPLVEYSEVAVEAAAVVTVHLVGVPREGFLEVL